MPFCPNCRYEYEPHVSECPDCGAKLVTTLPEENDANESESIEWVQLARINSNSMAEMVKGALENAGIPVVLGSGTGHFGITGQLGPSSYVPIGGGWSVYVDASQIREADAVAEGIVGEEWDKLRLVDLD